MNLSRLSGSVRSALFLLLPLSLCVGLFRWPEAAAEAAREGLRLCGSLIIPSLFPFFVLSSLSVSLGLSTLLGRMTAPVMGPLFHQSGAGASALVLGLLGGYPVGAKTVCELYQAGLCDREQARRLLAFCNNSGPAFVIGGAGIAVFHSVRTGFLLMGIQLLSACLVGLLFRPKQRPSPLPQSGAASSGSFTRCFTESVGQSAASTLHICAYVIFFNILIQLLRRSVLLPLLTSLLTWLHCPELWQRALLSGALELSNGVASLHGTPEAIIPASFLLSWGGLSVHFQTLSLLQRQGLDARLYLPGKALQACISAALACLLLRLCPTALTAAQLGSAALLAPDWLNWLSAAGRRTVLLSLLLWGGLAAWMVLEGEKRTGKHRDRRV